MDFGIGTYALGFLAGMATLLSPCVLPILPILVASALSRHRWGGAMLALGLGLSFALTGTFIATLGASIGLDAATLRTIAASLMVLFGAVMLVPQLVAQFQQKATERMQEALGLASKDGAVASLPREEVLERIRQEVTLYGIRIDIAEELARLSAHLAETRHILKKGGQVGKRLDFMMQELNREANTVGSKAAMKELADASMELKLLIDQMREQVQNLE